jgi:hypothetical protein
MALCDDLEARLKGRAAVLREFSGVVVKMVAR